jgi:hypothetical protein
MDILYNMYYPHYSIAVAKILNFCVRRSILTLPGSRADKLEFIFLLWKTAPPSLKGPADASQKLQIIHRRCLKIYYFCQSLNR